MRADDETQVHREASLALYADEEAELAELEVAGNAAALDVRLNLRITKMPIAAVRTRAHADVRAAHSSATVSMVVPVART